MPTSPSDIAIIRAYRRRIDRLRTVAAAAAATAWTEHGGTDEQQLAAYAEAATLATAPARAAAIDTASGMIAVLLEDRPPTVHLDLRTVDLDAWRQPFISTWKALKEGADLPHALAAGQSRANTVGLDTVTRTERSALSQIDHNESRIIGWRRVPAPPVCHWCATVATQRYRTAESASFGHQRCGCGVTPIIGDRDPGHVINGPVLDNLKRERDAAFVDEHGHEAPRPGRRDAGPANT